MRCLQVWTRSTRCSNGACIEVLAQPDVVHVRDAKLGDDSPVLAFAASEWTAFVAGIKAGSRPTISR